MIESLGELAARLPEYLGGVIPVCGTNPLNRLDYLRHRVHDRLSVAFVTGESPGSGTSLDYATAAYDAG